MSSTDGKTFKTELANAPWAPLRNATCVVHAGKMWVVGGREPGGQNSAVNNRVWWSLDGKTWKENPAAPWPARCKHSVVSFREKMWVFGGSDSAHKPFNDIWSSRDGRTWVQEGTAAWSPRFHMAAAVANGNIYVAGGRTSDHKALQEAWSSADGRTWRQATTPPWAARRRSHLESIGGTLFLMSGIDAGNHAMRDFWMSEDGDQWRRLDADVPWGPRLRFLTTVLGSEIYLLGGDHSRKFFKDMWRYASLAREAMTNGDAEDGMTGWTITANGGNKWKIEPNTGAACPAIAGSKCFVSSFGWNRKRRTIDLLDHGLTRAELDSQPNIEVSDWITSRSDCAGEYQLKATLRNEEDQVLAQFDSGVIRAPIEGRWQYPWAKVSHVFRNYGTGARYVDFEHGGKDTKFWRGWYGAKMTGASVLVLPKPKQPISSLTEVARTDFTGYSVRVADTWFQGDKKRVAIWNDFSNLKPASLRVLDYPSNNELYTLERRGVTMSAMFTDDGGLIACDGEHVTVLDPQFQPRQRFDGILLARTRSALRRPLNKLAFWADSNGTKIYTKGADGKYADPVRYGHGSFAMGISENESWIALGVGNDGNRPKRILIADNRGKLVTEITAPGATGYYAPAFFADDRYLATGGGYRDGKIYVFRTSDWKLERTVPAFTHYLYALDASPDGRYLIAGGYDGVVKLFDTRTWELVAEQNIGFLINDICFTETMEYAFVGTGAGNPGRQKLIVYRIE